jgi:predicted lipoprotein with Yx(FWY)xxD motif
MRPTLKFLLPALAASLTLAACGSSSKGSGSSSQASAAGSSSSPAGPSTAPSSATTAAVVKRTLNARLGATVLTDAHGLTLYRLSGEQNGKFICTSSCLQVWHPLSASTAGAPIGSVGSLGTVKRPDGTEQVTYRGMPLYAFAEDHQPGDAKGQGLKDVGTWNAVTTDSPAAPAAPASQPSPAAPSKPSGRYGY